MVHVPMPSHILCQKTRFFQKHVKDYLGLDPSNSIMMSWLDVCFFEGVFWIPNSFLFFFWIFFVGGVPQKLTEGND